MDYNSDYLHTVLAASGIAVEIPQLQQLEEYVELLLYWNSRVNLISRKDEDAVWRNHILHSLAGLSVTAIGDHARILDIGTGGGLPGIPLAILRPDAHFVLCDSTAKKIRVVENIVDALALQNVSCIIARVEEMQRSAANVRQFDLCVTRAVAPLEDLAKWCLPLLKPHSVLAAWKGGDLDQEIQTLRRRYNDVSVSTHGIQLNGEHYFEQEHKCIVIVQW